MHFFNSMLSSLPCPYQYFSNTASFLGFSTVGNHFTLACVLAYCLSPWMCRAQSLSGVQLFVTPWAVARQAPLSMGILQA